MLTAISRYGARVLSNTEELVAGCKARGELIQGPQIAQFEAAFARRAGMEPGHAVTASYGRMAFYYILKALALPAGSEIVLPTLTFWVVPALAKAAGLKVVFADVDPATFTMDPAGLPCDMEAILGIAARHDLRVIEDCAHALGATYDGRPVGTLGDAGFFSFQTLKPLNLYGGGLALVRNPQLAARVRELAYAEPWPDEKRITNRLLVGRLQRIFIKPWVFTISAFPILWFSALIDANPDVYLWEKIRSLDPLPDVYTERFPNAQAAIGLAALEMLDEWTEQTRRHAGVMNRALRGLPGITVPEVPQKRTHVYYQYCLYGPQRDELVVRCVRRGIDIETLHVDVCSELEMFADSRVEPKGAPGAVRAAGAMQIPVYSTLTDAQIDRVARVVKDVLAPRS